MDQCMPTQPRANLKARNPRELFASRAAYWVGLQRLLLKNHKARLPPPDARIQRDGLGFDASVRSAGGLQEVPSAHAIAAPENASRPVSRAAHQPAFFHAGPDPAQSSIGTSIQFVWA